MIHVSEDKSGLTFGVIDSRNRGKAEKFTLTNNSVSISADSSKTNYSSKILKD